MIFLNENNSLTESTKNYNRSFGRFLGEICWAITKQKTPPVPVMSFFWRTLDRSFWIYVFFFEKKASNYEILSGVFCFLAALLCVFFVFSGWNPLAAAATKKNTDQPTAQLEWLQLLLLWRHGRVVALGFFGQVWRVGTVGTVGPPAYLANG